jgi:hypothetical protein
MPIRVWSELGQTLSGLVTLWLGSAGWEGLPEPAAQCMHFCLACQEHQDATCRKNVLQGQPRAGTKTQARWEDISPGPRWHGTTGPSSIMADPIN